MTYLFTRHRCLVQRKFWIEKTKQFGDDPETQTGWREKANSTRNDRSAQKEKFFGDM
jgi:hypothetical protein